jgi:ribose 5-phosphate isomerase B
MAINLAIGADHAGFEMKALLIATMSSAAVTFVDFGTNSNASMDYPDVVHPLCDAVEAGTFTHGILICGSAQGVAMTANKHKNIRAAIVWDNSIAQLSRQHNNANVICLPARFISPADAIIFITTFINTKFEGGRHQNRIDKICI